MCCPHRVRVPTEIGAASPWPPRVPASGRPLWGRPGHCGGLSGIPASPHVTTTDVPRHGPVPPGGRTAGVWPRGFHAGFPRRCAGPGRVLAVRVRVDRRVQARAPRPHRAAGRLPVQTSVSSCWASGVLPVPSPPHTGRPGTVRPRRSPRCQTWLEARRGIWGFFPPTRWPAGAGARPRGPREERAEAP